MPTAFAIAAHPDDIEFVMAGTLLLLRDAGWAIHYMNIANGCCGSNLTDAPTTTLIRAKEAQGASMSLGATFHASLVNDIEIFYDQPTLTKLAAIVRRVDPQIVLTHSPDDYMEDHMNACRLAVTAAFTRGMPNYPADPPTPTVSGPLTIYHAQPHGNVDPLGNRVTPTTLIDVSTVIDRKAAALECHASQRQWLDETQGMNSYVATMKQLSQELAEQQGHPGKFVEGWRKHSHLGFCAADNDPLNATLAKFGLR